MSSHRRRLSAVAIVVALAGCAPTPSTTETAASVEPTVTPVASDSPSAQAHVFPTELFAGLSDDPVSSELAAELQQVIEASAGGDGLTATLITPHGTWSGATGMATAERTMLPNDQMSIANITITLVAAQVMQLVEAGVLSLADLAADRLPPDLDFNTNGATIVDLLSMRSGYPDLDEEFMAFGDTHPLQTFTTYETLGTVAPERGPVGQAWEYVGTNYLLLGLITEQVTGRSFAEVLRDGVLSGDRYERLIYQPDERPTEPMAMPAGASADTFADRGAYLPSLNAVGNAEDGMASDAPSLAQWFRALCAGQVVSAASLNEMTDFAKRPEYGLGIIDRRSEYGLASEAVGHMGSAWLGYRTVALCFQDPGIVVVVLANEGEHDVDTTAGALWRAASSP